MLQFGMLRLQRGEHYEGFNGHPPLGVNATAAQHPDPVTRAKLFQWAPTLGGECYTIYSPTQRWKEILFQWAPTLGGECYWALPRTQQVPSSFVSMGTHPWG